jgi:YidC/Oxa1 family membrane protein insertase
VDLLPLFGSTLGQIFAPFYTAMGALIAFFYALIPNYAVAIALLTVVVMVVTAPLTVKSTKSMSAMQRLSPELKKLQQKYKGDRQTLNEEMMKLYKEHGVNPASGCLPLVAQFPVFIILYGVIRGLANTVVVKHKTIAEPRYISHNSELYKNLVHHPGNIPAFGLNLADKVLGHSTLTAALPYAALILIAIGLQYFQMRQLNSRNPQYAQANPQAQMMQRYMPILFAVIYINISAGVNIYFIVSSLCRIGIQEAVFRSGILERPSKAAEEVLPSGSSRGAAPKRKTFLERLADAQQRALEQKAAQQRAREELMPPGGGSPAPPGRATRQEGSRQTGPSQVGPSANGGAKGGKPPSPSGSPGGARSNGRATGSGPRGAIGAGGNGASENKPAHPRAKGKRARKDR